MSDMDFARNCVFIDDAGFNLRTQRNYSRSRKGTPAKSVVPTSRGITITTLGPISQADIIEILLKKPQTVSTLKKKKGNYLVIDNSPIYTPAKVRDLVESRGL
jgi:hypothetical protein